MGVRFIGPSALVLGFVLVAQCQLNYRLPTSVWPSQYVLDVTPYFEAEGDFAAFSFAGTVNITLKSSGPSVKQIVFHSHELKISPNIRIHQVDPEDASFNVVVHEYDPRTQQNTLQLNKELVSGKDYVLRMSFVGNLTNDMHGFYKSSYDENGSTKWLAATQFEPTHARRAFPCFDEPRFKANFLLSVSRPANFVQTVANTRIATSEPIGNKRVRETFKQTPIMSTYLLAFIVSEFPMKETADGKINIYSRSSAIAQTAYSLGLAEKGLDLLSKTFEYDYFSVPGIQKLSLAAIPDFAAGAMENWGLLTYRETALLYDSDHSSIVSQEKVAATVIHEEVHMWFGDLVTCEWWSYTWLNEGFARYFNFFVTAQLERDWKMEWKFVTRILHSVLASDSLEGTKPMTLNVNTPEEISDAFGTITYDKGASIIRMVEHVMENDKFMAGLKDYLKQNAFKTATPNTLFNAWQKYAFFNVSSFMEPWTTQAGYPVVTVRVHENRASFEVTQKRFFLNEQSREDKTVWTVPLSYASANDNSDFAVTKARFFLQPNYDEGLNVTIGKIDWIVFNVQQTGFYRVNYDEKTWQHIADALQRGVIHVLNRAQIVDDSLNLARSGLISYYRALDNIRFLANETHYSPWQSAISNFDFIANRLQTNHSAVFKGFVLQHIESVYRNLTFHPIPNEKKLDTFNRISIIRTACLYGHKDCIKNAEQEYVKSLSTTYKIPVDIVEAVYCTVVHESTNGSEWNTLWDFYLKSNVAAEKDMLLGVLGCSRKPNIISAYLSKALTDDIRPQDRQRAIAATFRNTVTLDAVLDFVLSNHTQITDALRGRPKYIRTLSALVRRLVNSNQLSKFDEFVKSNAQLYGDSEPLKNARVSAGQNLRWAEKNEGHILTYIANFNGSNGASALSTTISSIVLIAIAAVFIH